MASVTQPLKIGIVGGGIAGLSAAISLRNEGFDVTVGCNIP